MVLSTQGNGVIIAVLDTETPTMPEDAEVMSVSCGVPTDRTAAISGGLQSLFAA